MSQPQASSLHRLLNSTAYPTIGLTDDIFYATEWGAATGWFTRLALKQPLLSINSAVMTNLIYKAIALLAAAGFNTLLLWSLEDLLQSDIFRAVLREAQKHLPSFEAVQLEFLLLAIARDWVQWNSEKVSNLEQLALELPRWQRVHLRPRQLRQLHLHSRRQHGSAASPTATVSRKSNSDKA